jgi:hypothetical protein
VFSFYNLLSCRLAGNSVEASVKVLEYKKDSEITSCDMTEYLQKAFIDRSCSKTMPPAMPGTVAHSKVVLEQAQSSLLFFVPD